MPLSANEGGQLPKGVYKRKTWVDRFWEYVDPDGPTPKHRPELGACHLWTGSLVRGYGQFWLNGKHEKAHRVAWLIEECELPSGMAMHLCDNKACVRRSHLMDGDHQANMQDRNDKGRQAQGERNAASKGDDNAVEEIRALWDTELYTQAELAVMYDRSQVSVSQIVNRKVRKTKGR
jgi:hypothetical protein